MLTGGVVDEVFSVPRNATIGLLAVGSVVLTGGDVVEVFSVPRDAIIGTGVLNRFVPLPSSVARGKMAGAPPGMGTSLSCPLGLLVIVLSDIVDGIVQFPRVLGLC